MSAPIPKRYLTANDYLADAWRLADAVRRGGWRPDLLIALWRGGTPPGVAVHEFLKVTGWDVRHAPLACASYTGLGEHARTVAFPPAADAVLAGIAPGERVLVVDDVFDTGRTAAAVKSRIESTGAECRLACVYFKPPNNETTLRPDYFTRDMGSDWLVFPHEIEGLTPAERAEKDPTLARLLNESAGLA